MKIPKGWRKIRKNEVIREGNKFYRTFGKDWANVIASIGETPEYYRHLTFIKKIKS